MHDLTNRRRVTVEVTPVFHNAAEGNWRPMATDWHSTLAKRFTTGELERIIDFVRAVIEVGHQHTNQLRDTRWSPTAAWEPRPTDETV